VSKRAIFGIMLTTLLVSMLTLAFNIRTDGSTYPPTEPIKRSKDIATFTGNFLEQQIVGLVNGSRAYNYDLELENIALSHYAFRSGGSLGANETANWIKEQFESFGIETSLEPFEFTTWDLLSKPSLIIDDDGNQGTTSDQTTIASFQCEHYSWPTPTNGVFAELVILPLPSAANHSEIGKNPIDMTAWDAINTTGKIVLIGKEVRWSSNWFQRFLNKIWEQPPVAVVYTWWYDWMSFTPPQFGSAGGRGYWGFELPAGFVNYEDGLWIRNRENAMNVSAHVTVRSVISTGTTYNVVGKITGYENPEKLVIISSHYDTVMCGGFCDNGAGTAGVIELANVFADAVAKGLYKPSYTLLFVAFTSEELWLVGSINYVKQHKSEMSNIIAVINLDCIGSDELYVTETNPVNGFDLDQTILNAAQDLGIPATLEEPGASDHETFRVPAWANDIYYDYWGLDANISDATPVESSAMLDSYPLLYSDKWSMGTPGWIHTSYDNSTSTETLDWVEVGDLENHIQVAALTIRRVSPNVAPRHDIAIVNVTPSKTAVGQTYSVHINVATENQGDYTENFNVTIYVNTTIIATFTNLKVTSGSLTTLTFAWNTAGFARGNYTIKAVADQVPGETDTGDNTGTCWILITKAGDFGTIAGGYYDFDDKCDYQDLFLFRKAYVQQYHPLCDFDNDHDVDYLDLFQFRKCYII